MNEFLETLRHSAPLISLLALAAAIAIGYLRRINTGILSIAFALPIGLMVVGMSPKEIVVGWPLQIFFILAGVTFLFSIAAVNGTLKLIAQKVTFLVSGQRRFVPVVFFLMSAFLAAIGPGNIAVCALVLPIAMAVSSEERIPPLLMATMVIAGANAGGLSPIAPTGIIAATCANKVGLETGMPVFFMQIIGQGILAATLYFLLRGHRLKSFGKRGPSPEPFNHHQISTIVVILAVVVGVIACKWSVGLSTALIGLIAFTGGALLLLMRVADQDRVIAAMPWSTLILVCGVGVLLKVCDQAGGIQYMTDEVLRPMMNHWTVAPLMAIIGGLMSIVSSASGVVLPTLIPTVPDLVNKVGGDATTVVSAIIMGAHVVTNSPLSTLGALAVASAGRDVNKERLFRGLLLLAFAGLGYAAVIVMVL